MEQGRLLTRSCHWVTDSKLGREGSEERKGLPDGKKVEEPGAEISVSWKRRT